VALKHLADGDELLGQGLDVVRGVLLLAPAGRDLDHVQDGGQPAVVLDLEHVPVRVCQIVPITQAKRAGDGVHVLGSSFVLLHLYLLGVMLDRNQ
ncbi:hypothetical protein RZS08_44695, partial [Arthrospira platensis SPKY1]|nr:hypothetical protein [Arthrospira platensis SPKY1]